MQVLEMFSNSAEHCSVDMLNFTCNALNYLNDNKPHPLISHLNKPNSSQTHQPIDTLDFTFSIVLVLPIPCMIFFLESKFGKVEFEDKNRFTTTDFPFEWTEYYS